MNDPIIQMLSIALVTLGASYIQSVTGFGFGIFSMIFLPSLLLYTEASTLSSVLSTLTSIVTILTVWRSISFKNIIFPTLGSLVSTYLAVSFVSTQSNKTLILLLGIALFILSIYFMFFSDKIRIRPSWYAGLVAGAISGVMSGIFSIGGPPAVIYFLQSEEDTPHYMATISAFFVLSGIITVGTKISAGFMTSTVVIAIAVGVVAMLTGSVIGKVTRDKIKPILIRRAIYGIMALSGIVNIVTSII